MSLISIILRGADTAIEYQLRLALDSEVSNFRLNAQTLVGFDDQMCKLVLHRTNLPLVDSLRFEETDIRPGDILTVVPFVSQSVVTFGASSQSAQFQSVTTVPNVGSNVIERNVLLVAYRLIPLVNGVQQVSASYIIQLQSVYENKPMQFFKDYGGQEKKKLKAFLDQLLKRDVGTAEVDSVIQAWCDDISVGYKDTVIRLD